METSLHRELKSLYSDNESQQEVTFDGYRIDVVSDGRLVEIQYGSLAAIRDKVRALVEKYDVLIVKPLAARKFLVNKMRRGGPVKSARYSPTRQIFYNLFDDLVHFVGVFPHPRLTLEALLTEQEEHRLPAGRRRWRSKGYRVGFGFRKFREDEPSCRERRPWRSAFARNRPTAQRPFPAALTAP